MICISTFRDYIRKISLYRFMAASSDPVILFVAFFERLLFDCSLFKWERLYFILGEFCGAIAGVHSLLRVDFDCEDLDQSPSTWLG